MSTMVVDHPEEVVEWRKKEFKRMGFDDTAATVLTFTRADLHDVEKKMLGKGCSHELVVRIVNDQLESDEG